MNEALNGALVIFTTEFRRLIHSIKFKILLLIMAFPAVIYLLNPQPQGTGVEAMRKAFQSLMIDLIPNYWAGIIGQFIIIILMSDLLASEIDKGTIRLLISKPVKISEILIGKFIAGISVMFILFAVPYAIIWLYNPLVYHSGTNGVIDGFRDLALALGSTLLVLASLGALAVVISVIVARPLYASLSTFGIVFLLQFIIPQIPYITHPERYTLGYQTIILLKSSFNLNKIVAFKGNPSYTVLFFSSVIILLLVISWVALSKREFPD